MTTLGIGSGVAPTGRWTPVALCALSALGLFVALQALMHHHAAGFEYPLDDVYIHLAVAEQIARGNYGVNAGELSSPASSPLYPFLLVPFAGTEAQRVLPLVWNLAGLLASAVLFGRIVCQVGLTGRTALAVAAAAPLALNMPGLAATGMEHSLHMAASLAILSGLVDTLRTGRIGTLLAGGILLAPALRPEGLALSLAASGAVALRGRWGAGAALAALGLAPQVAFALFLRAIGLDPVPSSVLTKLDEGGGAGPVPGFSIDLSTVPGQALFALTVLVALAAARAGRAGARDAAWLAWVAVAAGGAHLLAGKIGWLNRYEPYALAIVAAGALTAIVPLARAPRAVLGGGLAALCLALAWHYTVLGGPLTARNALAIHLQQAQMARFVHKYAPVPVAVNDIGWVAWTGPAPVLDLWGLASAEARRIRLSDPAPGWAAPLAEAKGVELAMIYDRVLGGAVGPDWVRLGTLRMDHRAPRMAAIGTGERSFFIGGFAVTFYAADPEAAPRLTEALDPWAATLPEGAVFERAAAP